MSRALLTIRGSAERARAMRWLANVPNGTRIEFKAAKRSLPQNDRLWAMLTDVARQKEHNGRRYTTDQWKVLFISGHAIATGIPTEVVPGLEGEFLNIRESSAKMSKRRMNSLIEYTTAWCIGNNIRLSASPSQEESSIRWASNGN